MTELEQGSNVNGASIASADGENINNSDKPNDEDDLLDGGDEEFRDGDTTAEGEGRRAPCDPPEDGAVLPTLLPTFDSKGKFKDYENRGDAAEVHLWDDQDDPPTTASAPSRAELPKNTKCLKQCAVVLIFLAFLMGIIGIILIAGNEEEQPLESIEMEENLARYNYPYVLQTTSAGWVSWVFYGTFAFTDGEFESSAEDCAARCYEKNAPVGAWSVKYKECYCKFVSAEHLCREPCVEEEYVNFSTYPIMSLDYCDTSVCEEESYHSKYYCDVDAQFDKTACAAKKDVLGLASPQNVPTPAKPTPATARPAPTNLAKPENAPTARPVEDDSSTMELDLTQYSYPYVEQKTRGWVSWPPGESLKGKFYFPDGVNTTSAEECAAHCQDKEAPTGTWSVKYKECWCNFVDVTSLCREPCVEEEYVDFSTVEFTDLQYCETSVCGKEDFYHDRYYCYGDLKFDKAACDAKIDALVPSTTQNAALAEPEDSPVEPESSATDPDLSKFGYPYYKGTGEGWISWAPEFDRDNFEEDMSSLEECAAKCQDLKTTTGAWSAKYKSCWCHKVDVSNICMEPCIENDYVDFSKSSLASLGYCEKSICDKDWYYEKEYCDVAVKFEKDACDAKIEALNPNSQDASNPANPTLIPDVSSSKSDAKPESSATEDLSNFGYPYTQDTKAGWLSWPPEFDDSSSNDFGPGDDVNSIEECAAKCQALSTPTGAWSEKFKTCWCYLVGVSNICKEPCIDNDSVDFSTIPISDISYCEKSYCDKDWYFTTDYCDVDVKFDKDSCDAEIKALSAIHITPSAEGYITATDPDDFYSHKQELRVEHEQSISFIKFDLSTISDEDEITKATLNLRLTAQVRVLNASTIDIDHVYAGNWSDDDSISWNAPPNQNNARYVNSIDLKALPSESTNTYFFEVDVTSAINPDYNWITFRISTKSIGTWYFADSYWNDGEAAPELVIA